MQDGGNRRVRPHAIQWTYQPRMRPFPLTKHMHQPTKQDFRIAGDPTYQTSCDSKPMTSRNKTLSGQGKKWWSMGEQTTSLLGSLDHSADKIRKMQLPRSHESQESGSVYETLWAPSVWKDRRGQLRRGMETALICREPAQE